MSSVSSIGAAGAAASSGTGPETSWGDDDDLDLE